MMGKEYAVLIGYRIRQERMQRNISQPEMAEIEVLIEICREFGISSDRILRDFVPVDTRRFCLE